MKKHILILSAALCLWNCKEDAIFSEHSWYELEVESVEVDNTGINASAQILSTAGDAIIEKGFKLNRAFGKHNIWGDWENEIYPTPDISEEEYPLAIDENFTIRIGGEWDSGVPCTIQAYIKTANRMFISKPFEFIPKGASAPEIHSVSPETGLYNTVITLKGNNFSKVPNRNRVYVNNQRLQVIKAMENELEVETSFYRTGFKTIDLYVGSQKAILEDSYYVDGPEIVAISPLSAVAGDLITLTLKNVTTTDNIELYFQSENSDYPSDITYSILSRKNNEITLYAPIYIGKVSFELRTTSPYLISQPFEFIFQTHWKEYGTFPNINKGYHQLIHNNKLYIPDYNNIHVYDMENDKWSIIKCPDYSWASSGIVYVRNNYLYTYMENYTNRAMQKYNFLTDEWSLSTPLPDGDSWNTGAATIAGDDLYIIYEAQTRGYLYMKYSFVNNSWVMLNNDIDKNRMFTYNNEPYSHDQYYIYKMPTNGYGEKPEVVYELSTYSYIDNNYNHTCMDGDKLYFTSGSLVKEYNFSTGELRNL